MSTRADDIYQRFAGIGGSAYFIGGFGILILTLTWPRASGYRGNIKVLF